MKLHRKYLDCRDLGLTVSGMGTPSVGDWVRHNREAKGLSQQELADLTGTVSEGESGRVSKATISNLERGSQLDLRGQKLRTLERVFNSNYPRLIKKYVRKSARGTVTALMSAMFVDPRRVAVNELGNESNSAIGEELPPGDLPDEIPLLADVRGGLPDGGVYDGTIESQLPVRGLYGIRDPQAFALRVVGDSMAPRMPEGALVFIAPNEERFDGEPCFVQFGGERDYMATIKNVYDADKDWLLFANNQNFHPQTERVSKSHVLRVLPVVWYAVPTR